MLHLLATGPAWTDEVLAVATVIGVAGALLALGLSLRQLRLQTGQLELQTRQDQQGIEIRLAERGLALMQIAIDLERVAVEIPALGPYLHEGRELPAEGEQRNQVVAYAAMFMGLAETVGWQTRVNQMSWDAVREWQKYFKSMYDSAPALRFVVERDREVLAGETCWFLGIGPVTEPIERVAAAATNSGNSSV